MRLRSRLRQLMLALVLLILLSSLGVVAAAAGGSAAVADKTKPSIPAGEEQSFRLTDGSSAVSPSPRGEGGVSVSPSPLADAGTSVGRPSSSSVTGGQTVHAVRFDPANGSAPVRSTVREGGLTSPPANPQRDGYRFDGWMQEGRLFDFRTPVLQDMVLTAQWARSGDWALSPDRGPAAGGIHLTINPPSGQEPTLTCVQASGGRLTALGGDGSLYTWTATSSLTRLPAPAQAGSEFRYLQAVSVGDWQMILGSDQQIYVWTASHPTPVPLDAGRGTRYMHISGNGEWLMAVDRQGRVHVFQTGRQDHGPSTLRQAETVLPQGRRAVLAVASAGRLLAVDEDGQAWSWSPGQADPHITRISQNPSRRIIQAEPLSQGILLLDADGQAHWLADEANDANPVNLTGGRPASLINTNEGQAVITDADGHLWAWKPGEPTARIHDDGRVWTQATSADGRITALDRQGGLASWSPGQTSKPVVITIASPPLLEAASLDGQPLRLTWIRNAWQATTPAHKPGPASIAISGRQAGQPFAENLEYTFEQDAGQTPGLARTAQPDAAFTVSFDTAGGSPQPVSQQIASPYQRVRRPTPDPERDGFLFDGWFNGKAAYDFSRPVTQNLALTARWTPDTWAINPEQGSQLGGQATTITPPATRGIQFNQISSGPDTSHSLAISSDGNAYAWGSNSNGQLGDGTTIDRSAPITVRKPTGTSKDFTYTQVSAAGPHSLAIGSDGYVYAWGRNQYGELGNNSTSDSHVPVRVRDPAHPNDPNAGLKATQAIGAGFYHSLAFDDQEGSIWAWGYNGDGELGNNSTVSSNVPVQVKSSLAPIITAARFDASPAAISRSRTASNTVTAVTPPHQPGPVTVSIDYTLGGTGPTMTNTSLTYTYQPLALPKAGGAGILLTLTAGATGTGAILASRRRRHEQARTGR
ncbi:InlB B-repeat-containing protein [Bifidobacterium sp. B4081]|uniref:InlB B-repeat-containing protein n=1 Tax=Bifidobacterium sp. B4081 TaxID=2817965 RepID=UPI00226AA3C6|nr:InlB B-repeat-containing protein [Bifidobacterium sp. B4081]MCX8646603.1 InlB B-repeat-containing protein [Bifidobacterium sp. B4081]